MAGGGKKLGWGEKCRAVSTCSKDETGADWKGGPDWDTWKDERGQCHKVWASGRGRRVSTRGGLNGRSGQTAGGENKGGWEWRGVKRAETSLRLRRGSEKNQELRSTVEKTRKGGCDRSEREKETTGKTFGIRRIQTGEQTIVPEFAGDKQLGDCFSGGEGKRQRKKKKVLEG